MARVEHRLLLVDVDRGHPRATVLQRGDQRAGLDQRRPLPATSPRSATTSAKRSSTASTSSSTRSSSAATRPHDEPDGYGPSRPVDDPRNTALCTARNTGRARPPPELQPFSSHRTGGCWAAFRATR